MIPWYWLLIALAGGAGLLWLGTWWKNRNNVATVHDMAETLANSRVEEISEQANANDQAARENASDRLNLATSEANERATDDGIDLADFLRNRGAGE